MEAYVFQIIFVLKFNTGRTGSVEYSLRSSEDSRGDMDTWDIMQACEKYIGFYRKQRAKQDNNPLRSRDTKKCEMSRGSLGDGDEDMSGGVIIWEQGVNALLGNRGTRRLLNDLT